MEGAIFVILVLVFLASVVFLIRTIQGKSFSTGGVMPSWAEIFYGFLPNALAIILAIVLLIRLYPSVWEFITSDFWMILLCAGAVILLLLKKHQIIAVTILLSVAIFYYISLKQPSSTSGNSSEKKQNATREMLDLKWTGTVHPGQELSLPPIYFKGNVKIRVNGHSHYLYYPSIKDWVYRDKRVESYVSPDIYDGDVIKIKADISEKEPFTVYLYEKVMVEVPQ